MSNTLAVLTYLVLNLADMFSTMVGLRAGLHEISPVPAWGMATFGELPIYTLKEGVILLLLVALLVLVRRYPWLWRTVHIWNLLFALVVAFNLMQVVLG
ncbi:DUF5658 family protein [Devosia sp.]|uniref:DUF5658 family protein n=1 Tax=Devosia sp. TaxID=1871048 RepID=UPI002734B585|nr:DUF5658 family protein [Devosia sp.]MDP2779767.1 DUF5658 family protein [Devosia sp.]